MRLAAVLPLAVAFAAPRAPGQLPVLVEVHCVECHTGPDAERGFDVAALFAPDAGAAPGFAERLALAVRRLRTRTMPPPDAERLPSDAERRALTAVLAGLAPVGPGARIATLRRLTRRQYEHTVRDLFGIEWRSRDLLPGDASAHGCAGIGDVQNVSPLAFEKYLDAADAVATAVLDAPAAAAAALGADELQLACALSALLRRAFRRPVDDEEIAEWLADYDALRARGADVADARHALLRAILVAPSFLFRAEVGQPDAPWRLSAHELAVRLSYLLTSSMPDAELSRRADDASLLDRDVLVAEAQRLAHARGGRGLAEDFAVQWLLLDDVLTATADFRRFPAIWNTRLRPSMKEEAIRLFAAVVGEDRSVLELLDADYTFVDDVLATHYGLPDGAGAGFRRVALPDRRRGGLLGTGAMLMPSSYPLRTSPVKRGRWILATLLDAPPPPPPGDAGALPPDDQQPDGLTLRQRLERHRSERRCAACHAEMDALGFALENYDPLGRWRDDVHGAPVDASAELPDGTRLDGPVALKDALLARADDFVRAFAKNLLVHGVGRDMVLLDEPALAAIVAAARHGADRFDALLAAVVTSPLFVLRDPDHTP